MNQAMFNEISRELRITKEIPEDDLAWQNRIKYSVLGLQMLSSLYDKYDDFDDDTITDGSVSKQQVSSRAKKLASIFELGEDFCDDILSLYIKTGFILNKSNRLAYPPKSTAQIGQFCVARGVHPSYAFIVSGLGFLTTNNCANMVNIGEMFGLQTQNIEQWRNDFDNNIKNEWKLTEDLSDFEFLNDNVAPWKKYWTDIVPKKGFSLCRSKDHIGRVYKFLSITTDGIKSALLPDWVTKNGEFLRLAISLRLAASNPPNLKFKSFGKTTILEYDYLLPSREQNFIELYSWKRDNSLDVIRWPQSRILANELLPTFIQIFERMGYLIQEE